MRVRSAKKLRARERVRHRLPCHGIARNNSEAAEATRHARDARFEIGRGRTGEELVERRTVPRTAGAPFTADTIVRDEYPRGVTQPDSSFVATLPSQPLPDQALGHDQMQGPLATRKRRRWRWPHSAPACQSMGVIRPRQ